MGLMPGLMLLWGAAAGTWIPAGMCELSLRDTDLPCPFISILIMFDAVLAKLGVLSPEEDEFKCILACGSIKIHVILQTGRPLWL